MLYVVLCILCSTAILLIFKYLDKFKIPILYPIVINYFMASSLGLTISPLTFRVFTNNETNGWLQYSIFVGILLIIMFFIMGKTIQKAGICTATIAGKMSVVLPILFALFFDPNDTFSLLKGIEITLALAAVFMLIYKHQERVDASSYLFPILLFLGLGIMDSVVKYAQLSFIHDDYYSSLFSTLSFSTAGVIGVFLVLFWERNFYPFFDWRVWIFGILLGSVNFGSLYFFINALNATRINNSLVFGINNIGVVLLSVSLSRLIFGEKLSKLNTLGVGFAVVCLILLCWSLNL